jgi:hypothetical protein
MGRWAWVLVLLGCAHDVALPRFTVVSRSRVGRILDEHRFDLVDCFDQLADRRDAGPVVRVVAKLMVRSGLIVVAEVKPLDVASVVDGQLVACLGDRVARLGESAPDGDEAVTMTVRTRLPEGSVAAATRAEVAPVYRPGE